MPVIDLHCHTTASDGTATPLELVRHAVERAVDVIAITDHDTVGGVERALEAAKNTRVRVVPGIELSTRHDALELHVLGYFININSEALLAAIDRMSAQRRTRAERIVDRLGELGYDVSMDEVDAQAQGDVIARPHIARVLLAKGYVSYIREAFTSELIGDGGRAYVAREALSAFEAIELIRSSGGVAAVAHPGVLHHEGEPRPLADEAIADLVNAGLSALEVDHPDHPPLVRDRLAYIADEYGLVRIGGSDWHGLPEHSLGGWTTSEESFRRLEEIATAGG